MDDYKYLPPEHPEAIAWVRAKRRRNLEIASAVLAFGVVCGMFVEFCRILTS